MERRLGTYFRVKAYVLDPSKCVMPEHGTAKPQVLPNDGEPLDSDPFGGLPSKQSVGSSGLWALRNPPASIATEIVK